MHPPYTTSQQKKASLVTFLKKIVEARHLFSDLCKYFQSVEKSSHPSGQNYTATLPPI
jgi:hypothetical protein